MKNMDKLSIFISLILRHKPEVIGITLDEHGWAKVDDLISGMNAAGRTLTYTDLQEIVEQDKKQRYSFNNKKTLIRANQGHSIPVDVQLKQEQPPNILYHGTASKYLEAIQNEGLKPMSRLYVHLSPDIETARKVGSRHDRYVKARILKVFSGDMYKNGEIFYRSENGVWLTKYVDVQYLEIVKDFY